MKHVITTASAAMLLLLGLYTNAAAGQVDDSEKTYEQRQEDARIERLWNLNWRPFAPFFLEHDGQFICVPNYSSNTLSSAGQSVSDYRNESAWQQTYTDERGKETTRKLIKPEEEAFAAVALIPKVEVGQFGYIHSGHIATIKDEKTLELQDIWLVDAHAVQEEKRELKEKLWGKVLKDIEDAIRDRDRHKRGQRDRRIAENEAIDWGFEAREEAIRHQRESIFSRHTWVVKGYATDKLKEDARWPSTNAKADGLQLIVVEVKDRTVTAVPAATINKGITELQFIDYLQSRELNKAAFIELVNEAKREARGEYVKHVLAKLLGNDGPKPGEGVSNEVQLAE